MLIDGLRSFAHTVKRFERNVEKKESANFTVSW